ncbi:Hypothetical_protein [Hexamita inflata]|uniref:Hypothetical_protein n=1 Tax=Hexamita inflata TaxID=28002 RepID=A0AA86UZW8_9EUKA|nr:Hypothetical protein HINF_LOCUS58397 [Hexamita inflata]
MSIQSRKSVYMQTPPRNLHCSESETENLNYFEERTSISSVPAVSKSTRVLKLQNELQDANFEIQALKDQNDHLKALTQAQTVQLEQQNNLNHQLKTNQFETNLRYEAETQKNALLQPQGDVKKVIEANEVFLKNAVRKLRQFVQNEGFAVQVEEIEKQLDQSLAKSGEIDQQNENLTLLCKEQNLKIQEMALEKEQLTAEAQKQVTQYEQKINMLQNNLHKVKDFEAKASELDQQNENLAQWCDNQRQAVKELTVKNEMTTQELQTYKTKEVEQEEKVNKLKLNLQLQINEVNQLTKITQNQSQKLQDIQNLNNQLKSELVQVKQSEIMQEQQIYDLKQTNIQLNKEISSLNNKIIALTSKLDSPDSPQNTSQHIETIKLLRRNEAFYIAEIEKVEKQLTKLSAENIKLQEEFIKTRHIQSGASDELDQLIDSNEQKDRYIHQQLQQINELENVIKTIKTTQNSNQIVVQNNLNNINNNSLLLEKERIIQNQQTQLNQLTDLLNQTAQKKTSDAPKSNPELQTQNKQLKQHSANLEKKVTELITLNQNLQAILNEYQMKEMHMSKSMRLIENNNMEASQVYVNGLLAEQKNLHSLINSYKEVNMQIKRENMNLLLEVEKLKKCISKNQTYAMVFENEKKTDKKEIKEEQKTVTNEETDSLDNIVMYSKKLKEAVQE